MSGGPMATPVPWNLVSGPYRDHIQPAFRKVSARALALAELQPESRLVDVACGPGTLAWLAAERGHRVEALDFSSAMIAALEGQRSAFQGPGSVTSGVGDGQALPYGDATFDAGFSMFGLMFFPDRVLGLRELRRVVRPGGVAVVSSWRPLEEAPFMAAVFGTLGEMFPNPPPPRTMTTPEDCLHEMTAGGFGEVTVHDALAVFEAPSFDALWSWFPASCAPLALLADHLGDGQAEVFGQLKAGVRKKVGEGPQRVEMPALITIGRR